MVSFSICISPTNAPISLVPPRFNNITHCCERGMHACKFATVFRQFRGYAPDALLPLLCRKIATGYSAISIIDVNAPLFFPVRRWFTRTRKKLSPANRKNNAQRFFERISTIRVEQRVPYWWNENRRRFLHRIIKHTSLIWYSSYFGHNMIFEYEFWTLRDRRIISVWNCKPSWPELSQ